MPSVLSQIHRTVEQPRLEGPLEDHLIQPFMGNEAWMRLIFHMKTALIFSVYVVQITLSVRVKRMYFLRTAESIACHSWLVYKFPDSRIAVYQSQKNTFLLRQTLGNELDFLLVLCNLYLRSVPVIPGQPIPSSVANWNLVKHLFKRHRVQQICSNACGRYDELKIMFHPGCKCITVPKQFFDPSLLVM